MNKTIIKAKILRWLRITKPIALTEQEVRWIKLIKGHYKKEYPSKGEWTENLKTMFDEVYGWSADEYYRDFLNCIFYGIHTCNFISLAL